MKPHVPKVTKLDPRVIEAKEQELTQLRARVALMPAGSTQRYQGETLVKQYETQLDWAKSRASQ